MLDEVDPLRYCTASLLPGKEDAFVLFKDPADLTSALLLKLFKCHRLGWRGAATEFKENTHRHGEVSLFCPAARDSSWELP